MAELAKLNAKFIGEAVIPDGGRDLFSEPREDENGCRVEYVPVLFDPSESSDLLTALVESTRWQQDSFSMYGKTMPLPRLTAWYGDAGRSYTYSGIRMQPHAWTTQILAVKERVEELCSTSFNSVLLNQYRDGRDSVAWHSDDEPELGECPTIASVSFGQTRVFKLRRKPHKKGNSSMSIELGSGSCLVMSGMTQVEWEHEVPKTARQGISARVNLTFRTVD